MQKSWRSAAGGQSGGSTALHSHSTSPDLAVLALPQADVLAQQGRAVPDPVHGGHPEPVGQAGQAGHRQGVLLSVPTCTPRHNYVDKMSRTKLFQSQKADLFDMPVNFRPCPEGFFCLFLPTRTVSHYPSSPAGSARAVRRRRP